MLDSEPDLYDLQEQLKDLQKQVFYLTALLKFHNLYDVPSKYKKFNPKPFENPFYEVKGIKKNPKFPVSELTGVKIAGLPGVLNELPDADEIRMSKERMMQYNVKGKKSETATKKYHEKNRL